MTNTKPTGPLSGLKVLEFAGLGPAPFCGMLLSDLGADVVRIDRPDTPDYKPEDVESRGRRSIVINLKQKQGVKLALSLIGKADILIEGFRPGVMEKLGLGPDTALAKNPALVYGRMTGWGQTGPLAQSAGHDINYLGLTGALHAIGPKDKPAIPLNLLSDFGGGALYLAMGILAALRHTEKTGEGQVVDCAMVDGVTSMLGMIYGDFSDGRWQDERQSNVIDGGAHFYNVYRCADGKWLSLAAIEPQFYAALLKAVEIDDVDFEEQWKKENWSALTDKLSTIFLSHSRDEWCELLKDSNACLMPVLSLQEAQQHPHNLERSTFVDIDGVTQPAPAPRFSRTPASIQFGPTKKGSHADDVLNDWKVSLGSE